MNKHVKEEIYYDESLKSWMYSDTKTIFDDSRPCKRCSKHPTKEEDYSCTNSKEISVNWSALHDVQKNIVNLPYTTEPKVSKPKLKTKFVPISDELWNTIKDADRVIFTKGSDSIQGLIFYSE